MNSEPYDLIMAFDKFPFIRGVGDKNFLSDHCVKILQVIFISFSWARLKSKPPCILSYDPDAESLKHFNSNLI